MLLALLSCTCAASARAQVGAPADPPLLNPNLAKPDELAEVKDLSPEVAKLLVEQRPFLRTADFEKFLVEQKLTPEQRTAVYGRMFLHINLNEATKEEMKLIPGMGDRMIHEFEEYRPYKTLAQFRREIGKYVDAKELARLEQYVFVPINLNTASDEDLMSIPGLGKRMLREFKEYRPYRTIEQFRREIGKYVDAKEVARLEIYVTLGEPAARQLSDIGRYQGKKMTLATWQRIMGGMWPRRREYAPVRKLLASALAVALFHQLGACPCGCIDGNLWVQSYLRLTGAALAPKPEAGPSKAVQHGVDAGGCDDDHSHVVYLASHGPQVMDAHGGLPTALALSPNGFTVASFQDSTQQHICTGGWPPPGPSARKLAHSFRSS